MRSPLVVLVVVVASSVACGSASPSPPPTPPVAQHATCEDAGALLRGRGDVDGTIGRSRESVITRHCETMAWPKAVLECVAKSPTPRRCLEQLPAEQVTSYEQQLAAWDAHHPELRDADAGHDDDADDDHDDHDHDDDDDDAAAYHPCETVISSVESWAPPITVTGDDRGVAVALRTSGLLERCKMDGWSEEAKGCLAAKLETLEVCLGLFDDRQRASVTLQLAKDDQLVAKAAKLRKQASTHTCPKVVAAHYSDARWKPALPHVTGADRTQAIAASRTRMRDACTSEKWTAAARACVVAGGGDACVSAAGASRWGFPAMGVVTKIGIPECDAYVDAVIKMSTCAALPQATRDALMRAVQQTQQAWGGVPPEGHAALATACRSARDAVQQLAVGCPP